MTQAAERLDAPVRAFNPDPDGPSLVGANGQRVIEVYSSGPRGTVREAESAAGLIVMKPGAVSAEHAHLEHEVNLVMVQGAEYGALTLYGDSLEHAQWITPPIGVKVILPNVPHVAVYPAPEFPDQHAPDLHVVEFKAAPRWQADTYPVPGLERALIHQLHRHGLLHRVTLSPERAALVPEVTGRPLREFLPVGGGRY